MSFSHIIGQTVQVSLATITSSKTYTGGTRISIDEAVPTGGAPSVVINCALDVSAVKSFYLMCDQVVTVKTNSNGAPDDTIVLAAGVPYVWNTDSYDTFQLATDVVTLHVTNASGTAATLQLEALVDPTP